VVVDQAEQRSLRRDFGEQTQRGQPDDEAIGRRSSCQAEHRAQRVALWPRKSSEMVDHRGAQLMQCREGELHLGLDASRSGKPATVRVPGEVLQES
jgi:hypothetical protein